jgi:ABC-2 type transport system ATP-binding protein
MPSVVVVDRFEKRYGSSIAVEDVSFSVEEGEIFGILGPNGAGKTTTVECLQGLRKADGGKLRVLGYDPDHEATQLRRRIGSQLQESALPDRIKVWEALRLFSSLVPGGPDWKTVMEQWDLTDKRAATFGSLSGGQQQRLFVALALVNDPELVFLDEMTTGLDPSSRRIAWGLIRQIRDGGTTVVLVTHFMEEAENLCDRVAVIKKGRIAAIDTPDGLIRRYADNAEVTFSTDQADLAFLHRVEGVAGVKREGRRISVTGQGAVLAHVAAALVARGLAPFDLQMRRANLEDVFLSITNGGK